MQLSFSLFKMRLTSTVFILLFFYSNANASRLPITFIPESYKINIIPNFDTNFFVGAVEISGKLFKPGTTQIFLYSEYIKVNKVTTNGNSLSFSGANDILSIELSVQQCPLQAECILNIEYEGRIHEDNTGLYKGEYTAYDGTVHNFYATHFQATYARRVFPCFDEPFFKTTFTLSITTLEKYKVISNTPQKTSDTFQDGTTLTTFVTTPKMSTYLLAFVISEFDYNIADNHEIYARKDYIADLRQNYAFSLSIPTLKNLEEFTGIPYALPKIAQVAIPDKYFGFGGMENWGIILYKESRLLSNEKTTAAERQRITQIVAHEYIHQWFGNLVTPQFWDYIWLSEGLARLLEYHFAGLIETTYRLDEQFVIKSMHKALDADAEKDIRPMHQIPETSEEANNLFDTITYDKAASVFRMVQHFLTFDVFVEGLKSYLDKNKFNAVYDYQLWSSFTSTNLENLPKPLHHLMEPWVEQNGYPYVFVTRDNAGKIILAQKRFTWTNEDSDHIWNIPINFATSSSLSFDDTRATHWMTDKTLELDVTLQEKHWIILNKLQTGYYRVNYDDNLWTQITTFLYSSSFKQVPAINRAQLLDDAFSFAKTGILHYYKLFDLLLYTNFETDYIPLTSFVKGVTNLCEKLIGTPEYDTLKKFFSELLKEAYNSLGTKDSSNHIEKLNRDQVITLMCRLGNQECQNEMLQRLKNIETELITPDLQATVYCSGMIKGGDHEFNLLVDLYRNPNNEQLEKQRIIKGIGCSEDKYIISAFLSIMEYVFKDNKLDVLVASMTTPAGIDATIEFLKNTITSLNLSEADIKTILTTLGLKTDGETLSTKAITFLLNLPDSYGDIAASTIKTIEENNKWVKKFEPIISSWLVTNYAKSASVALHTNIFLIIASIYLFQYLL